MWQKIAIKSIDVNVFVYNFIIKNSKFVLTFIYEYVNIN